MKILTLAARLAMAAMLLLPAARSFAASRIEVLTFAPLSGDLPPGAGEKGADILTVELKGQSEFEVIPRQKGSKGAGVEALALARKRAAEARKALDQRKPAEAQKAFEESQQAYMKGLSELSNFDEFVNLTAEYATLLYRRGKDDQAAQVMTDALRVSVGHPPKILAQSPTYAPIAEALTKKIAALPKGSIRLDSTPEGAHVYIDGQDAGNTPVVLKALPEGRHYIRAILPSQETWGEAVVVSSKGEAPHLRAQSGAEGPAAEVAAQLAENRLDPSILGALQQVAARENASLLAFGALVRTLDGIALDPFLYNAKTNKISRLKRVSFDQEMLDAGLQMDKVVSEIQAKMKGDPHPVDLPSKVVPDLVATKELPTEYMLGGPPPEVSPDQPIVPSGGNTPTDDSGKRRVIKRTP
jgi:hypothetical protein